MLLLKITNQFYCVHLGPIIQDDLVQMKQKLVKVLKPNSLLIFFFVLLPLLGVVCVDHEAINVSYLRTQKKGNAHNDVYQKVFAVFVAFVA